MLVVYSLGLGLITGILEVSRIKGNRNEWISTYLQWDLNLSRIIILNLIGSTDYVHPCVILTDMMQGECSILWTCSHFIGHINSFWDTHCRWMTKCLTDNCNIFPFFNISTWMYWYCHVSRRYCEDRKHGKACNLEKFGQVSKILTHFLTISDFWPSNFLYIDKQLLIGQVPEALKSCICLQSCSLPSIYTVGAH